MHKYFEVFLNAFTISLIALSISMGSFGWDWYIANSQADIIYSSVNLAGDLHPFFSFNIGGGAYFSQDPQSPIFTLAPLFIWLLGPDLGVRLNIAFIIFISSLGAYLFFTRFFSHNISLYCMTGWTLSSGLFWRIVIGNDMFAWHFLMPLILYGIHEVFSKKTFKSAVTLGTVSGVFLLGPTLHTIFYFAAPLILLYLLSELIFINFIDIKKIIAFLTLSFVIALCISIVKFSQFYLFKDQFYRPTNKDGVSSYFDFLYSLFFFFENKHSKFTLEGPMDIIVNSYGNHEFIVAPSPLITLFAIIFFVLILKRDLILKELKQKKILVFGIFTFILGSVLSLNADLWFLIRDITKESLRVSPRFIILSGFSLVVLSGLCLDYISKLFTNSRYKKIYLLNYLFAFVWIFLAARGGIINFSHDPEKISELQNSSSSCYKYHDRFSYTNGFYENFYFIAGNNLNYECNNFGAPIDNRISIENNVLKISKINVNEVLELPFNYPIHGFIINNLNISVFEKNKYLVVKNNSQSTINNFQLTVKYPAPYLAILVSFSSIIFSLFYLIYKYNVAYLIRSFLSVKSLQFRFFMLVIFRTLFSFIFYLSLLNLVSPQVAYVVTFLIFSFLSYFLKGKYVFYSDTKFIMFFVYLLIPICQMLLGSFFLGWLINYWNAPASGAVIIVSGVMFPATYFASKLFFRYQRSAV
jgi:hypothetical protein